MFRVFLYGYSQQLNICGFADFFEFTSLVYNSSVPRIYVGLVSFMGYL